MSESKKAVIAGVEVTMNRCVPLWDETKVMVRIEVEPYQFPRSIPSILTFFGALPASADVNVSDSADEWPGYVDIGWTEDATEDDLAEHLAKRAAEKAEADALAEFEAWKIARASGASS